MSGYLMIAIWCLLGCALFGYLLHPQIRRWWRGSITNRNLPPHQRWPEILHWHQGDEFKNLYFLPYTQYQLVAIQEDGYAIVQFCGERDWVPISRLIGHNVSLRTRYVNEDLKSSGEYMEMIRQFNIAYGELQERDKRLKLVS